VEFAAHLFQGGDARRVGLGLSVSKVIALILQPGFIDYGSNFSIHTCIVSQDEISAFSQELHSPGLVEQ